MSTNHETLRRGSGVLDRPEGEKCVAGRALTSWIGACAALSSGAPANVVSGWRISPGVSGATQSVLESAAHS
jgi:hypothetical protein